MEAWDCAHFPRISLGNARADLNLVAVNSASRAHHNYALTSWRSNLGNPYNRLFKVANLSPPWRTCYMLFNRADQEHRGHIPIYASFMGQPLRLPVPSSDLLNPAHVGAQAGAWMDRPSLFETGPIGAC